MSEESEEIVVPWSRRILSTIATLVLVPGSGHFALGRYRRGFFWLGILAVALPITLLAALLDQPWILWLGLTGAVLCRIAATVDTLRAAPAATPPTWVKTILLWILLIVLGEAVNAGFRRYVFESFRIPAESMTPTLLIGDHIYVNKLRSHPARGQIIVFMYPEDLAKDFIKRIIAISGDTVQVCGGQVIVNDQPLRREAQPGQCEYDDMDEMAPSNIRKVPCVAYREWNGNTTYRTVHLHQDSSMPSPTCTPKVNVPSNHVFVMGDHRDRSHDSRAWGPVHHDLIKGPAWFVWWSRSAAGLRLDRINLRIQ